MQRGRGTGRAAEPGKTVLLSTVPKQAPKAVDRGLLIERVNNDLLVIVRNTPVVSAPLNQVLSPACQRLTFTAHADKVTGEFVGLVTGSRFRTIPAEPLRGERSGYDFRPQIVGVFTDLAGPAPPGLEFSATLDSRYSTSPTLLKTAGDDRRGGDDRRRARRPARPGHRRRPTGQTLPAAAVVVGRHRWTEW